MAQFQQGNGVPPTGGQAAGEKARFQSMPGGMSSPGSPQERARREQQERDRQIDRVQNGRRRHRHGNYIIYYVLLGMILTIVCVVLSLTVFFNIHTLSPSGSTVYSSEQILAAVNAKTGDNLLRLNTDKLEQKALAILTKADSVQIRRHFPDRLDIVVTDGDPVLQVSQNGAFYQFTEKGRLVGVTASAAVDAQVVVGPDVSGLSEGQYLDSLPKEQQGTLSTWRIIRNELWDYSINDISAMDLSNELRLRIYYQNRIEIDLGTLTDMDAKMATLKAILYESGSIGVDETGRVDLTNPDRVYFNNQTACTPPAGAAQAGWSWADPYSDSLEQVLYAPPEPEVSPQEAGTVEGGEDGTASEEGEPSDGDVSSEQESEPSSEENYETSGGMRLPQVPSVGGNSGSVSSTAPSDVSTMQGGGTASDPQQPAPSEPSSDSKPEESSAPAQYGPSFSGTISGSDAVGGGVGTQAPSVPGISH